MSFLKEVEKPAKRLGGEIGLDHPVERLTVRIPYALVMLGIGRSKLYEPIKQGEIETIKLGSATLVVADSLRALVQRQRSKLPDLGSGE